MAKDFITTDYETFCGLDLKKVGSSRYVRDESAEVLMGAYSLNDSPTRQWAQAEGEDPPREWVEAMLDPEVEKWAWNANFEIQVTKHILQMDVPIDQWRCTMVLAMACSLPGKLEKAGPILNLEDDHLKDTSGTRLINKFSKTRVSRAKATMGQVIRTHWYDDYEDWQNYLRYNRRDVDAESAIRRLLAQFKPMSEEEWSLWHLDQIINARGIPFNLRMVRNAVEVYHEVLRRQQTRMDEITGLDNANSLKQLLPWLQQNGYPFEDCTKASINLAKDYFDEKPEHWTVEQHEEYRARTDLREVLDLRLETSRSSIKKYDSLLTHIDDDGLLRNSFQFAGAQRTWRWAGRVFQPHNLPRPEKKFEKGIAIHAKNVEHLDAEGLGLLYGNVFDLLASTIRPAAQAPEGMLLLDADLNAIENRVLGWMAHCRKILKVFELKRDPYISFATYLYDQDYDELFHEYKVEGNGAKRTIAKPGTLGCPRGDTLTLTQRGWVRLDSVRADDLVHDGVEWVKHDGLIDQGVRHCVNLSGVVITGDHEVWQGGDEWLRADQFESHSWNRAIEAAASSLSDTSKIDPLLDRFISADAIAVAKSSNDELASFSPTDRSAVASIARAAKGLDAGIASARNCSTFWQTGSTPFDAVARNQMTRIGRAMAVAELSAGSTWLTSLSGIASNSLGLTEALKSTVRTMTATTRSGTFDSVTEAFRTAIASTATRSRSMADGILLPSSEGSSRRVIETIRQSLEKLARGRLRTKSSPVRHGAGEHTVFDLLNAGPRNRFTVLSADGPCVIHNCGYMMGAGHTYRDKSGEIKATGLLGYAWDMGVKSFTQKDSEHSVEVFRREFSEVKDYWYGIERAAKKCVRTGNAVAFGEGTSRLVFDRQGPFMRMILPSGRALRYVRPRLEMCKMPWGDMKETLTYEGLNDKKQWVRQQTHPGKLTENADQAISRDLLAHGMMLAHKRGLDLRMHVHDQLVALSMAEDASNGLDVLIECMEEPPFWAPDMPLGSNGFTSPVFMKD